MRGCEAWHTRFRQHFHPVPSIEINGGIGRENIEMARRQSPGAGCLEGVQQEPLAKPRAPYFLRNGQILEVESIMGFIETHNEDQKPFVWTKSAEEILVKVGRARHTLHITKQFNTLH